MLFDRYPVKNIVRKTIVLYAVFLIAAYSVLFSVINVFALTLDSAYEVATPSVSVGYCGGGPGDGRTYCRRNCTSYVAYRLAATGVSQAHYEHNGHGKDWFASAKAKGIATGAVAKVGAVAYWTTGGGGFGHVAWVDSVNTDGSANTSNYNGSTGEFYKQNSVRPEGYIYFSNVGSGLPSYAGLKFNVTSATNADGRIEVFAVGTDGKIYSKPQVSPGGAWRDGWNAIPAQAKSITAVTSLDGRIELFYVGQDNAVWHRWQTVKNGIFNSPEERLPASL